MALTPNFTSGTFNERIWPGVGDVDECAPMSDFRCLTAIAGWEYLPSITAYRAAAGDPDDGVNDGFTVDESIKGIKGSWPKIGALCQKVQQGSWATVQAAIEAGHPVSLSVKASLLPWHGTYLAGHRIAVYKGTLLRAVDPLKPAHSKGIATTYAVLKAAALGYGGVNAIIFPTVEQAFRTHPLYAGDDGITQATVDAAVAANEAKWEAWVATHP